MQVKNEKGLIVREHERKTVELPSEFTVSDAHGPQVHFSPTSEPLGPHSITCTTVDISTGGAGIEARHFLPRMCQGVLRVYAQGVSGSADRSLLLEETVKVRRVEMVGRNAHYALGLAFTTRGADIERRIADVLRHLHGETGIGAEQADA